MTLLIVSLIFLFGALLASFAELVAMRIPQRETLFGRSHCPKCLHPLRLIDVFPLFGYIFNRGKCHFCGAMIPRRHLFIETLGGSLFAMAYLLLGFDLELIVAWVFIIVMLTESLSDIEYQLVIDRVWIIGFIPLFVIRIIQSEFLPHLSASLVLFLLLYALAVMGKTAFRKEVLGGGDIKLYLFVGFCLSWQNGLLSLFLASLFGFLYGIILKKRKKELISLVPFLFIGVMIAYFWGQTIIQWYLGLFGV